MDEEREVLTALIENLYFSMNDELEVYGKDKLARAYSIAKQLYEYGIADKDEVEDFVNKVTEPVRQ